MEKKLVTNVKELENLEGITLDPTYSCGDVETDYDIYNGDERVCSIISNSETGSIKLILPFDITLFDVDGKLVVEK